MNSFDREPCHLKVRPLAPAIGAELEGVNLSAPLCEKEIDEIRQALLEHLVIFFRDQVLTPVELLRFAGYFGEPMEYPQMPGLPGVPDVTSVTKLDHETINFGGSWHSDTSYVECPPMASLLYAVEIPPFGGDTLFANQYLAYETLSPGLKQTLSDMTAVNSSTKVDAAKTRVDRMREAGAELKILTGEHPVVRTHPETARKALYINAGHTTCFSGWNEAESESLLKYLFQHQINPELTCRFRWQPGSMAFWDNRCSQHYPINDYHGYRRVMHRVTLMGDPPY